jgi:hypothetical protein
MATPCTQCLAAVSSCRVLLLLSPLSPDSRKGPWDVQEELLLCKWHSILGSHWAKITRKLEGRTENAVKNHWNAAMRAKVGLMPAAVLGRSTCCRHQRQATTGQQDGGQL